jgi:hypothetical protein
MHEAENLSLEAIGRLLEASEEIRFARGNRQEVYGWVERLLVQQEYTLHSKAARGLIRRYMERMTGLSRAQVTRLIGLYTAKGRVQPAVYRRHCFPQRYSRTDKELLALVDEAHKTLIEQTKSRPRQSGDNGLVETKNGAVIRKHIGYGYIDAGHADRINSFYREYLNPYLNCHRPCVTYPPNIASHSRELDFYFGSDFLLRRHEHHVEDPGPPLSAGPGHLPMSICLKALGLQNGEHIGRFHRKPANRFSSCIVKCCRDCRRSQRVRCL